MQDYKHSCNFCGKNWITQTRFAYHKEPLNIDMRKNRLDSVIVRETWDHIVVETEGFKVDAN